MNGEGEKERQLLLMQSHAASLENWASMLSWSCMKLAYVSDGDASPSRGGNNGFTLSLSQSQLVRPSLGIIVASTRGSMGIIG